MNQNRPSLTETYAHLDRLQMAAIGELRKIDSPKINTPLKQVPIWEKVIALAEEALQTIEASANGSHLGENQPQVEAKVINQ
jgi:hypothetical protein